LDWPIRGCRGPSGVQIRKHLFQSRIDLQDECTKFHWNVGVLVEFLQFGLCNRDSDIELLVLVEQPLLNSIFRALADVAGNFRIIQLCDYASDLLHSILDIGCHGTPPNLCSRLCGAEAALRRFPVQVLNRMTEGNFELELIQWVRLGVLILCFGGAAWLDHKTRRVSNEWWWTWAKPALFLLCLELLILEASWMIWLTASAAVAFASTALIGRPDIHDIKSGSIVDILVTIWYFASGVGLVMGTMEYAPTLLDYFDANVYMDTSAPATQSALLWGQMVIMGVVLVFFEMAWRFRMLHGGADAKAMMLATLLLPSWNGAAFPLNSSSETFSTAMPPALSLLIWAGLAFLVLPLVMVVRNGSAGDIMPLSMSWHASRMTLSDIPNKHVWLLEEVTDKPDGTRGVTRRMRPVRGSRTETDVEAVLEELAAEGLEKAWVTAKHPFLMFVFPAIIPLVLLGDPIVWIFGFF